METIYKSKFAEHAYDKKSNTVYSDWFTETANMNSNDFKVEMQAWLDVFRKCKPAYLFDYCVNFQYPISPEEQIWMAHLLNKEWADLGLKKYAHMVPEELFAEVSVDQLFDEFFQMKLPNQYPIVNFAHRQAALNWLHS